MYSYILIVLFSLLPSIFWLLIVRFIDQKNPEPIKEVVKIFFWGMIIVLPAFILVQGAKFLLGKFELPQILNIIILSFVIDGLIEEYAKYTILRNKIYKREIFNEPLDGLVYGVTTAMGFAFVENFLYLLFSKPELIIVRFTTPTLMHALAGGIIGYHLAMAKFKNVSKTKRRLYIFIGLLLAILFHGFYNSVIRYGFSYSAIPLSILIIIVYIYLLRGLRRVIKSKPADLLVPMG